MIAAILTALMSLFSIMALGGSSSGSNSVSTAAKSTDEDESDDNARASTAGDNQNSNAPDPVEGTDDGYSTKPSQTKDTDEKVADEPEVVAPPEVEELPEYDGVLTKIVGPEAMAGRVLTVTPDDHADIESIQIIDVPTHGNVTVNPDNTLALVLTTSDSTEDVAYRYEVTYKDGTTEVFESEHSVVEGSQEQGWGEGNFYMLETDSNDDVVVETGDVHRPVYVSNSDDALSRADIAALEGLDVSKITQGWLMNHPEYGGSEGMALDQDAGMDVWYGITGSNSETSHWLLLESGYSYDELGRVIAWGVSGEDELHPVHITSYGDGDRPVIDDMVRIYQGDSHNIVFSDVEFAGTVNSLSGNNVLFDDVEFSSMLGFQSGSGLTIRNSYANDIVTEVPADGVTFSPHVDRVAGAYVTSTKGILIEGNIYDHTGWADGYSDDGNAADGQPPSQYSHNFYFQPSALDLTFRDNISMRAGSFGAQFRGGAFVEDNAFIDNNAAVSFLGGDYNGNGPTGNYSLVTDNIITSGAHKSGQNIGALTMGAVNGGVDTTLINNIVAHLADPNNPDELAEKPWTHRALDNQNDPYFDDTIIYNWQGQNGYDAGNVSAVNTDGLDFDVLDQTTIQLFTAQLLGDPDATIADLGDFLRLQADGILGDVVDADLIIAFFQQGFGITPDFRLDATTLRFVPNELGDGIRWDNRLNWTTEDLPGTFHGDSVDLAGNWVNYGGNTVIENLDFGSGGELSATHGKLTVEGQIETGARGGEFNISEAGQIWIDGYADGNTLSINIDGGRFVNAGDMSGTTQTNVTDGQAILATDGGNYDVEDGSSLTIEGDEAKVGFDDNDGDTAVLRFEDGGNLSFVADDTGFSAIAEMRSGAMGDSPNVESGVNIENGSLEIDVSELAGTEGEHTLIDVDGLIGNFDDIRITGLGNNQDAQITVDYATDKVTLTMLANGSGSGTFSLTEVGDARSGLEGSDLWDALTNGQTPLDDADFTRLYLDDEEDAFAEA